MRNKPLVRTLTIAITCSIAACSTPSNHAHGSGGEPREANSTSQPTTVDIQGASEWKRSQHMRAFYDATVATFANGPDIDVDKYESRSFAIFREFARANGMNEQGMIDHLKLIPRQVVQIVKESPTVLKDYDSFWVPLAGPD